MQGKNTLVLNEATILRALSYFFDNVLYQSGEVPRPTAVFQAADSQFHVRTERVEE